MDLFSGGDVVESCSSGHGVPFPGRVECPACVMPGSVERCQGPRCRVMIRWVRTHSGALMPLDVGVFADGGIVLEYSGLEDGWRARVLLAWERERWGPVRWRAHWVTCPDAELYRNQRVVDA